MYVCMYVCVHCIHINRVAIDTPYYVCARIDLSRRHPLNLAALQLSLHQILWP